MQTHHRVATGRARAWIAAAAIAAISTACADDKAGTGRAEINPVFANENEQRQIGSIHVWAIRAPTDEDAGVGSGRPGAGPRASTPCGNLVGDVVTPYERGFTLLSDLVFYVPDQLVVEELPAGQVLFYLEAVDFLGTSRFAGCRAVELADGESISVDIEVVRPGTFDCGDPLVDDDAPCDDGLRCTVDEHCRGGQCTGGRERSCEFVQDACNSGACTEEAGCQPVPLPDGTSCATDSQCTVGDVCESGVCIGSPRDCSEEVGVCQIPTCDENVGCTSAGNLPFGTECDDGQFCTVNTTCDSFGGCFGGQFRDCSDEVGPCDIPSCNETDGCHSVGQVSSGTQCDDDDICTVGTQCNADGNCVGGSERDCASELTLEVCEAAGCDSEDGCHPDGPEPEGTPCEPATPCDSGQVPECNGEAVGEDACVCVDDGSGGNGNGNGNGA